MTLVPNTSNSSRIPQNFNWNFSFFSSSLSGSNSDFTNSNTGIAGRPKNETVWTFIDGQNFVRGAKETGCNIHWPLFRDYLRNYHKVTKAVIFLGYIPKFQSIYSNLERAGFELRFKRTRILKNNKVDGGNVDADLAASMMDHKSDYDKAILVADDSDYCTALERLVAQNKLAYLISPHKIEHTSQQIIQTVGYERIISIHKIRPMIERL